MTGSHSIPSARIVQPWILWSAIAALLLDAVVLASHVAHRLANRREAFAAFEGWRWDGALDGSYTELLGHVQLLAAALILLSLARGTRTSVYVGWALAFIAMALDDFFLLHERWANEAAGTFAFPPIAGLSPDDVGELAVWAVMAGAIGLVLLPAHVRSSPTARRNSWCLLGLTALLAVFGVGVDLLHAAVASSASNMTNEILTLTETTGELVGMTLILLGVLIMCLPGARKPNTPARRSLATSISR